MGDILKLSQHDDDDNGIYEPSDSEDDYSENEKMLLDKYRRGRRKPVEDSEDEVFGVRPSSDEEEEEENMESDMDEGRKDEGDLPDPKAWGKRKKSFYHTDYVDDDYGGYHGKDAEAAEYEEQEAREIQQRLAQQLDEEDFSLEIFAKVPTSKEEEKKEEIIKTDLSKLSKRQKRALLEKESPEFSSLIEDFKAKMIDINDKLGPVMTLIKEKKIPSSPACDFIKTKYHLILNYCTNIAFYLLLKARRINIQSHPVVRRLFHYRQLLKQLEPLDEVMVPQIEAILEMIRSGEDLIVTQVEKTRTIPGVPKKKQTKLEPVPAAVVAHDESEDMGVADDHLSNNQEEESKNALNGEAVESVEGKRAITYQIAKNKGLTPRRKKEQRNPRVKHRKKFEKAKIRRKGQVREARREIQKYGGEISGIKIGVTKSIKIK